MKRPIARFLILAGFIALPLLALDVPGLRGHINDYAQLLSPETVSALEAKCVDFEKTDSTQIAVLTIPSLQGEVIEDFSMKVAEQWKIGQKKIDNGVILLIARDDRKIRIEVGYGLEGRLTDLRSGRIIDNIMRPSFKAGDYNRGVSDGVEAIMQSVRGEYSASDAPPPAARNKSPWNYAVPGLIVFFFIGIIGKIKRILGGVAGAVIIPIAGILVFGFSLLMLVLIPAGFLIGLIIPTLMTLLMIGGGGSGSGGWSSSGGGFSGGGFSGGGGSFGGGGASGGW